MDWVKSVVSKSIPLPGWLVVVLFIGSAALNTGIAAYGGDLTRDNDLAGVEAIIDTRINDAASQLAKDLDQKVDRRFDEHAELEEARWLEVKTLLLETRQDVRELRAEQRERR